MDNTIAFLLNGEPTYVRVERPTMSLLQWLREQKGLTGTKEGCAEGDCGACTVVLGDIDAQGELTFASINACIRLLPTLHGKAIFTVEYLHILMAALNTHEAKDGSHGKTSLHPVQQAMVDHHASQCGFCTPGFVMSLWHLYLHRENNLGNINTDDIINQLSGNLCRCTGYRPIIQAAKHLGDYPQANINRDGIKTSLIALQEAIAKDGSLKINTPDGRWDSPRTVEEWLTLKADNPNATILAGATDVGLWLTKQMRRLPHLIYMGDIQAVKRIVDNGDTLTIGAGVPLQNAFFALHAQYPALQEWWERFASLPIRHAGTLGGNVANGSPIGDSMPVLIALSAKVVLASMQGGKIAFRELPLDDFYIAYQKKAWNADEVVHSVHIPKAKNQAKEDERFCFASYKVSKRFDSDISAVACAFGVRVKQGVIIDARLVYGGMAAIPKRAHKAEATLCGQPLNEVVFRGAMQAIAEDFQPLSDMRASSGYRLQVAQNLLWRFYLEEAEKIKNGMRAGIPKFSSSVYFFREVTV